MLTGSSSEPLTDQGVAGFYPRSKGLSAGCGELNRPARIKPATRTTTGGIAGKVRSRDIAVRLKDGSGAGLSGVFICNHLVLDCCPWGHARTGAGR